MSLRHNHIDYPTFWILVLGVIITIGPLSIDMYLPALPSMAKDFGISTVLVSNSVPAYFIGLVIGQLFYGPLSDRIGRIKPLYIGMGVYVVASIVCATTHNEYVLFVVRTIQALGACAGSVVTRAMVRDRLPPQQMAKAFSLMVLVMGLAPVIAPALGSLVLKIASWRVIFWCLAGFGLLCIALTRLFLVETLSNSNRNTHSLNAVIYQYWELLQDKHFNYPALGGGMLMGAMFIYISASPAMLIDGFGISPEMFSWIFAINGIGFIATTLLNRLLLNRFSLVNLLRFGAVMQLSASIGLVVIGLMFGYHANLWLVLATVFCCIAGLGFTQPNSTAIALAFQQQRAGMASAMQSALNYIVGIFGGLLLNVFPLNGVAKLGVTLLILMLLGCVMVFKIDKKLDLSQVD